MSEIGLRATALHKHFGGLVAVSDVSIDVHVGEIHAVIGHNCAGKSTLINLLSGELFANHGSILLGDADITRLRPDRRARAGLGRAYQKTTIFPGFSVHENVRLAAQARSRQRLRMFGGMGSDDEVHRGAMQALAKAGLSARAQAIAAHLSHGEQRQLEIAMALAGEPRLLLLDEPMAGMGAEESQQMVHLLRRLKSRCGMLLIEHDMDAVFALADRITVLLYGRAIASGTPEEIRANPEVRQAYLGEEAA